LVSSPNAAPQNKLQGRNDGVARAWVRTAAVVARTASDPISAKIASPSQHADLIVLTGTFTDCVLRRGFGFISAPTVVLPFRQAVSPRPGLTLGNFFSPKLAKTA
jgi:hypothetical protein